MIKVYQYSKEIYYSNVVINEDINMFSVELLLISPALLSISDVVLVTNNDSSIKGLTFSQDFTIVRVENIVQGSLTYTLCPSKFVKALNTVYDTYSGTCSVSTLLAKLGIPFKETVTALPSVWTVPRCKYSALITNYIRKNIRVTNGGGACLIFDLDNKLTLYDLKSSFAQDSSGTINGTVRDDTQSIQWIIQSPGRVNMLFYTEKGVENRDLLIEDNMGYGSYTTFCNSDGKDFYINMLVNDFYISYYTSRVRNVENAITQSIGLCKKVTMNNTDFLIIGMSITGKEQLNHITLKLARCPN